MAKMLLEWLKRWRCLDCGYVTFNKPKGNDCYNCSYTMTYEELAGMDIEDTKTPKGRVMKAYKRRELKDGNKRSRNKGKKIVPAKVSSATASH